MPFARSVTPTIRPTNPHLRNRRTTVVCLRDADRMTLHRNSSKLELFAKHRFASSEHHYYDYMMRTENENTSSVILGRNGKNMPKHDEDAEKTVASQSFLSQIVTYIYSSSGWLQTLPGTIPSPFGNGIGHMMLLTLFCE